MTLKTHSQPGDAHTVTGTNRHNARTESLLLSLLFLTWTCNIKEQWLPDVDVVLIIIGSIFMVTGIIGCILPVMPGPPVSYAGLLLLQFSSKQPFTVKFLIAFAILTVLVAVLDYVIPVYGTKKLQGSKYGIRGSAIGLVLGLIFFPPFGIIMGPILGAFTGELLHGKTIDNAVKSALGAFLGFLAGTTIKLIFTFVMVYHFIVNVI